jgi:hypothetical protein
MNHGSRELVRLAALLEAREEPKVEFSRLPTRVMLELTFRRICASLTYRFRRILRRMFAGRHQS